MHKRYDRVFDNSGPECESGIREMDWKILEKIFAFKINICF